MVHNGRAVARFKTDPALNQILINFWCYDSLTTRSTCWFHRCINTCLNNIHIVIYNRLIKTRPVSVGDFNLKTIWTVYGESDDFNKYDLLRYTYALLILACVHVRNHYGFTNRPIGLRRRLYHCVHERLLFSRSSPV